MGSTCRINGADLYCETAGRGDPLVLIHGFSLDHRMWDDQVAAWAGRRQVVRYDVRGFGRSSLPTDRPYSHAGDLEALLDRLDIGPADLVGFSMGAEIGLELARAAPQRVRRLVLAGPFLHDFSWQTFHDDYRQVMAAGRSSGVAAARAAWMALPHFKPAMARAGAAQRIQRMIADYSGWHFTRRDPQRHSTPPVSQGLAQIKHRTLVVVGEEDTGDFKAIADLLQRRLPSADRIDIPRSGHLVPLEDARTFNRLSGRFLDDTNAS